MSQSSNKQAFGDGKGDSDGDGKTQRPKGPQFIVNMEGKSLDLCLEDQKSVTAHPFHGGRNQQWLVRTAGLGDGEVTLQSRYNGSYVGLGWIKLVGGDVPLYWNIVSEDAAGAFKLHLAPCHMLHPSVRALAIGDIASLDHSGTELVIVDSTEENAEAIMAGRIPPSTLSTEKGPSAENTSNLGTNHNVTINVNGNSLQESQRSFTTDGNLNIHIWLGQPQVEAFRPLLTSHYPSSNFNNKPTPDDVSVPYEFPTGYFRIRAAGRQHYWSIHYNDASRDGNGIILWTLANQDSEIYFIDSLGALRSRAGGGVAVDVINNVLVMAHNRPPTLPWPNPWSHPLPTFRYSRKTQIISVEPHIDPLLTPNWPRSDDEWRNKEYVVRARTQRAIRIPKFEEIVQWTPRSVSTWTNRGGDQKDAGVWCNVGVEEKTTVGEGDESMKWVLESI